MYHELLCIVSIYNSYKKGYAKIFIYEIRDIRPKFQEWEVPAYKYAVSARYAQKNRTREAFVYDTSYFILFEYVVFQYVERMYSDFILIFQYLSGVFYRFILRSVAEIEIQTGEIVGIPACVRGENTRISVSPGIRVAQQESQIKPLINMTSGWKQVL